MKRTYIVKLEIKFDAPEWYTQARWGTITRALNEIGCGIFAEAIESALQQAGPLGAGTRFRYDADTLTVISHATDGDGDLLYFVHDQNRYYTVVFDKHVDRDLILAETA